MIIPKLSSALAYGGDYNPEQWPESVWREDVQLMQEAGVNLVTLGVFSWGKLQPAENSYEFGWFDRVMDLLGEHGIFVDLATATASPPPWMSHRYGDVLAIDANGAAYFPGSRQHYSPCSPTYRRFAAELAGRIAERYKKHPALAAWHINNEYGNHIAECHSPAATAAFRVWLRQRHGSLDALNAAWGTAFWSQHYSAWEEILTPRRTPTFANPAQQLDYKRFMSEAVMELFTMERDIVRKATPDVPVTTNFMGFYKPMNYQQWAKEMDFVSWDSYPDPLLKGGAAAFGAAAHDLTRSLKKDRPFVLMEQSISSVTWRAINAAKPPGLMRLWSWQALARGADGVLFFQWRASKAGAEKFLGGMAPHVPAAKSQTFAAVKALGAELKKLSPVTGSLVRAKVAIAFDWEAWWAVELDSKPAPIAYAAWAQEIHAHFYASNIAVDFVHPGENLERYAVVIAPALYLLKKEDASNLSEFVRRGGSLLATYFSGIVDENEQIVLGGYPALLRETLGLWVEQWYPMAEGEFKSTRPVNRQTAVFRCTHWRDALHLEKATALAHYADDDCLRNQVAFSVNTFGQGRAYYLGTKPDANGLQKILKQICDHAKVSPIVSSQRGVEATLRERDNAAFLFLLNHNERSVKIPLGKFKGTDLTTGKTCRASITLEAQDATVIKLTAAPARN